MERPPGRGAALHPSCRHKYLTLQKQLLVFPFMAGTGAHHQWERGGRGELPHPFSR